MARIIKTTETRQQSVSTFEHGLLDELLLQVANGDSMPTPSDILADARAAAEQKVEEAYAEGLRRGMEAGEARFHASVGETAEALREAASALQQARADFIASMEPQLVKLAAAMAGQILRRELTVDPELVTRTAHSVLEHVCDQERVGLRVNPADVAVLKQRKIELLDGFDGVSHLEILPDPSVPRGGCVAVTKALHVDGRLESQLEILLSRISE